MSVSLVIITHNQVGQALIKTVIKTFGEKLPLQTTVVPVRYNTDPEKLVGQLKLSVQGLNEGQDVLVLTDMYGSTPYNIAHKLRELGDNIQVITGLNLPMLIRVMNYPELDLAELTEKAVTGGREGVVNCSTLDMTSNEDKH